MNKNIIPEGKNFYIEVSKLEHFQHGISYGECASLILCTKGSATIIINQESYNICPNTRITIGPPDIISMTKVSEDFEVTNLMLNDKLFKDAMSNFESQVFPVLFMNRCTVESEEHLRFIQGLFMLIEGSQKQNGKHTEIQVRNFVRNMFLYMCDENSFEFDKNNPKHKERYFTKFIDLISKYHKESREVMFYANELNVSTTYLNNIAKKETKHTAKEIIDDYAIMSLKCNLRDSNRPLLSITEEYHFPNQSYLCRYFKKFTNYSPNEFRKTIL